MKTFTRTLFATAAVAVAAISAAGAAGAHEYGDNYANEYRYEQPRYEQPRYEQPRYEQPAPVYVVPARPAPVYSYGGWQREPQQAWRDSCGAGRWNPNVRYMPGDAVWRHGQLFLARRVSAHVWNQNSPPEWTPNFWRPARCA